MQPSEDILLIESESPKPGPSSKDSGKRRHSKSGPSGADSDRPSKRPREDNAQNSSPVVSGRSRDAGGRKRPQQTISSSTLSPNKKNLRRIPSPEVIPDSDEEMNGPASLTMTLTNPGVIEAANQASGSTTLSLHTSEHEAVDFHPLFDEEPKEKVPTLRTRLTEPRVKMIDDPNLSNIEGAIPTKAYVARMNTDPSSSKSTVLSSNPPQSDIRRSKPGPGRSSAGLKVKKNVSSLLTFSKGSLTTVRGKYHKEGSQAHTSNLTVRDDPPDIVEVDNAINEKPSPTPATAEELLRLAGLDTEIADALPDYDDNPVPINATEAILSETTEPVVLTADSGNGKESSSLDKERSADYPPPDTKDRKSVV